jgi:hypothetical protein
MQGTLTRQVHESLRPYAMFRLPDVPGQAITTKRGGLVFLDETPDGFATKIVRQDGETFEDLRPVDEPGVLAIAVRALVFKSNA